MRFLRYARQKAAALPFTLLLVAFNVTVVVALLIYATTELNASRNSLGADMARTMALNGVELAGALIAANSTNNAFVSYQNITNISGDRLETKIANTVAPDPALNWKRQVQTPTALHSGFASTNTNEIGVDLNYAADASGNSGYIAPRTNPPNSNWRNLHTNMFRMQWVNIYKGNSSQPTNLVGRFAFWVDDESTKLNLNYSGGKIYNLGQNYQLQSGDAGGYLPFSRTNVNSSPGVVDNPFDGSTWPFFMDLASIGGINRTNLNTIMTQRGSPPIYTNNNINTLKHFSPFYSVMEVRSASSAIITNLSEQSQLGFTATLYSREPELSYVKGIPRFDMYRFNQNTIPDSTLRLKTTNDFVKSLTDNYPQFSQKYSLPQFAASLANFYNSPSSNQTFTYTPSGGETPYFANKARPLLNEIGLKIQAGRDSLGNTTVTLEAEAELIFLGTARKAPTDPSSTSASVYDELGPTGDPDHAAKANNYRVEIDFSPGFEISGKPFTNLTLNQVDIARWFKPQTNDYYGAVITVRTDSQDMTNSFGVLRTSTNFAAANPVVWSAPTTISARVFYQSDIYQQTVPSSVPNAGVITTNYFSNNSTNIFFHLTSQPRGDLGVRSDPRLGIHEVHIASAPNDSGGSSPVSFDHTNNIATINVGGNATTPGRPTLNSTWRQITSNSTNNLATGPWSANYTNTIISPLGPDITPPATVFEADRGLRLINNDRQFMTSLKFLQTAADIGEIPITTFKSGNHLAWSTPKLWGDGRTNLRDGVDYPPDWVMLDCIHSVYLSARKPNDRLFSFSSSNATENLEHLNHGRLNINGMKSYFQIPSGSIRKADTLVDSILIGASTKHFVADQTGGGDANRAKSTETISEGSSSRTNVLNFIQNNVRSSNFANTPFVSPFEFLAFFAGNTNSLLTTNSWWMSYTAGSETTSDRRIESIVRSLFQKVTTRGWQYSVYSLGQALQVVESPKGSGQYSTNVVGEAYMQAVLERAPKHNVETGDIENASPGGAPPLRLLYLREIR